MSKNDAKAVQCAVLVRPGPAWRQRLESLMDSAALPEYEQTHSAEIDDAGDWRTCAIGERLGFPDIRNETLEEIILQTDEGLYGAGLGFACAVREGDIRDALEYHGEINSSGFDGSFGEVRAKIDLMSKVSGDMMPPAVASALVTEFDDVEVFADTVCDRCGATQEDVDVGVPDPEPEDLGECEACGGGLHAENISVLAYEKTYHVCD